MSITAAEFRAQVEALETSAIENCIAQIVARSNTATRAGLSFNCLRMDALSNSQRVEIAREVLTERLEAEREAEIASVEEAMAQAAAEGAASAAQEAAEDARQEAEFEAEMEAFETQIEDEEIAELAQMARELGEEQDAVARLRKCWEWGEAA